MDEDGAEDGDPPKQDFTRYYGYWHGFTFVIFDEQEPEAWIRSTYWVDVATEEAEEGEDQQPG